MNNNFSYNVQMILKNAEKEMLNLHHPYVGTEHLLLSLLKTDNIINIMKKYNITYEKFKNELISVVGMSKNKSEVILYTPLLRLVLKEAINICEGKKENVDDITLFKALISSDDGIAIRMLLSLNVDIDELYNDLIKDSSTLETVGINMLKSDDDNILVGRDKEINEIIEILLRKNKNNPVLIGEAGVGKSAIVYELARRVKNGCVPDKLKNMIIFNVDMSSLLSNTKYRGEFETRLNNIIKEITCKKNIILFIDEIHTIVKTGGGEGSCDAANILKPYLASSDIKIIGATTISEYEEFISKDSALSRRFAKIYVSEPSNEETLNILKGVKKVYEDYHDIKIDDNILKLIVDYADKYITSNHNPDKSLEVLDCLLSRINNKNYDTNYFEYNEYLKNKDYKKAYSYLKHVNNKKIKENDIISVIQDIANIKILNLDDYNNLCKELDKKIYGQDLTKLKSILKNKFVNNKLLSFEINGPEGTGKSYTASLIANNLKLNIIELDMMEYSTNTSINRLVGSDPGYVGYENEAILDKIKYRPYSLILLKNYEYVSSNVDALFSSIIKKGYLLDKKNNKINFNNTIIIKTTSKNINKIGYQNNNLEQNNIINYNLIDINDMKKYIVDNNLNPELTNKLDNKTNFNILDNLIYCK